MNQKAETKIHLSGNGQAQEPFVTDEHGEANTFLFLGAIFRALEAGRKNCFFSLAGQIYFLNFAAENNNNLLFKTNNGNLDPIANDNQLKRIVLTYLDIFSD